MNSKVRVVADDLGNVINVNENKPEYGWFLVEQQVTEFVNNWFTKRRRTALITGRIEDLVQADLKSGQEFPGKIVIKESLTPFNPENPDKDLKIAGDSKVICRVDDQPIYRKGFYTSNPDAQDELIQHMNTEEIREVQSAKRAISSLSIKQAAEATIDL